MPNPRTRLKGVSVAIVLSIRESRIQGEGPQPERCASSHPAECEGLGILAMSAEYEKLEILSGGRRVR